MEMRTVHGIQTWKSQRMSEIFFKYIYHTRSVLRFTDSTNGSQQFTANLERAPILKFHTSQLKLFLGKCLSYGSNIWGGVVCFLVVVCVSVCVSVCMRVHAQKKKLSSDIGRVSMATSFMLRPALKATGLMDAVSLVSRTAGGEVS